MSLERINEDGKPTETKSSQPPTQEPQLSPKPDEEVIISEKTGLPEVRKKLQEPTAEPKQQPAQQKSQDKTKGFFTREKMNADAERIRRQSKHSQAQPMLEEAETEVQEPEIMIPELEDIELWARNIAQELSEDTENAKSNQKVMLMATSVIKMCRLLNNYSKTMKSEMEKIAERELQNLNLQDQYIKSLKASTGEITRGIYDRFKDEQKKAFDDVKTFFSDSCDRSEKEIVASADKVKSATEAAKKASIQISKSVKRFCTVKTIGDLMYYAAPVAVVIDVLLRLFDFI